MSRVLCITDHGSMRYLRPFTPMKYTAPIAHCCAFLLSVPLILLVPAMAQDKALPCLLSVDFEGDGIPAGWDIGAPVLQLDGSGNSTSAWRIGNATEANSNGFFPVPDRPVNNRFIMANDDAAPCNCAMDEVVLTSPSIDLASTTGAVLQCKYFFDGNFNSGVATVNASVNGGEWIVIDTLTTAGSQWQDLFVDLSAYDGATDLRIRFRWSDNGQWASGVAVDDLCVRGRYTKDISVLELLSHDPEPSPFNGSVRSLRYSELPLTQTAPLTLAASLRNNGTDIVRNVIVTPSITLNGSAQGPLTTQLVDSMVPGETRMVRIPTDWTPSALGLVELSVNTTIDGDDEDNSDNGASTSIRITGPGWADGYGAMTSLEGDAQGIIQRDGSFIVLSRMELVGTASPVSGISAILGTNSQAGARIRGVVFDTQLAFLDTTATHELTSDDLNIILGGGPIHLPWANITELTGDHFVGIQVLDDDSQVSIASSGNIPTGAAMVLIGANFEVDWLQVTPMIRLHTSSFGVGVTEMDPSGSLVIGPNPASTTLGYRFDGKKIDQVEVFDMWGRQINVSPTQQAYSTDGHLDVSSLSNGCYTLSIRNGDRQFRRNFLIAR